MVPDGTQSSSALPGYTACCRRARDYLVQDALPFWSSTGAYSNGCFVERLDLSGKPVDPGFVRVRMQARQIYVFANAEVAGLFASPRLIAAAADFLVRSAWLGPANGWASRVSQDGELIDGVADLYDISFALFALAWLYRLDPNRLYLEIAHATLDFLDRAMRHPLGGYFNDAKRTAPRLQNPHMHLTEALNAWFEASGQQRFLDAAGSLIQLLTSRFYDAKTGALGEYFDEGWRPCLNRGQIVEPGHQFEWAWIIGYYGRLSGLSHHDAMRRLLSFAFRHGFDEGTGLTVDHVGRDGRVIMGSHRLWPQTEALKACIASERFLGESMVVREQKIVNAIFHYFLNPGPVPGTWIDHYNADGSILSDQVPATSLYHITLAFLELLRSPASSDP